MKFEIYSMILENHLINSFGWSYGWGMGYVLLPEKHPFYGKNYDDINIDIHGGLTFGQKFDSKIFLQWLGNREILGDVTIENYKNFDGYWIIGFDTNHAGDDLNNCSRNFVIAETEFLLNQCLDDNIDAIKKYKYIYTRRDKLKAIGSLKRNTSMV
jgi:hypothetical protein